MNTGFEGRVVCGNDHRLDSTRFVLSTVRAAQSASPVVSTKKIKGENMITENGTIKVSTALDEKMQKELTRGSFATSLTFIILGSIGVALFLVLEIVSIFLEWEDGNFYFLMTVLFAIILGSGISLMLLINKNLKAVKGVSRVNTYEFYQSYFIISETLNGETVGSVKIYNNRIMKAREVKNYLFFYINAGAAYPVSKAELSEAELNTIKNIFRLNFNGGTVNLAAAPVESVNIGNAEDIYAASEPQDPFEEFKDGGKEE